MHREEDIISYDFQGWPNYKMTIREILQSLGATTNNGFIGFNEKDPILDIYPQVLEDDGMAYGVNEKFVIDADVDKDKTYINIFAEAKIEDEEPSVPQQLKELGELFKDQIEAAKKEKEND
jgi:hypothetical protein